MLMTEKGSLTKSTDEELDDHSTATSNATPLDQLLVNSTVPAVAVAVKVCEDSADEIGKNNGEKQKRGILSNFQRRTFSRISFKGETGPLLSRWIYFSFFFFVFKISTSCEEAFIFLCCAYPPRFRLIGNICGDIPNGSFGRNDYCLGLLVGYTIYKFTDPRICLFARITSRALIGFS